MFFLFVGAVLSTIPIQRFFCCWWALAKRLDKWGERKCCSSLLRAPLGSKLFGGWVAVGMAPQASAKEGEPNKIGERASSAMPTPFRARPDCRGANALTCNTNDGLARLEQGSCDRGLLKRPSRLCFCCSNNRNTEKGKKKRKRKHEKSKEKEKSL